MDVINMEVKINNNGEMLDATIEIVDGVMVVSPKEVKFEPKDGDVVVCEEFGSIQLFICKKYEDKCCCFCYCFYDSGDESIVFDSSDSYSVERFATEEEKKKLFDKLAEEGYEWKPDTKELVKLKWKPNYASLYYRPAIRKAKIVVSEDTWSENDLDKCYYDKGWVFKTYEECDAFCDKLKQAIKGVKP